MKLTVFILLMFNFATVGALVGQAEHIRALKVASLILAQRVSTLENRQSHMPYVVPPQESDT